jgi:hypothetical protein
VQLIEQSHPTFGGEFIARASCPPEVAHHATAVAAARKNQGYLVRSSQSTHEMVVEVVQQVTKAIDSSLPAYVDQGRSGWAACATVMPGIAITRFIVRALMQVH